MSSGINTVTILVGVLCDDGVVIGADSSATFSAGSVKTIEHPVTKVHVVSNDFIFAFSGSGGLSQRFTSIVQKIRAEPNFSIGDHLAIAKIISRLTIEDFSFTNAPKGEFGAIVAFTCKNQFYLCEFDTVDLQPEFKMDDIWFVSVGSGQPIADPFLGLLSRVFFEHSRPKLSEGIFITLWTLLHAIEVNLGGIKGPPTIAVLTQKTSAHPFTAHLYSEDELEEHRNNVKDAEQHLAAYRSILAGRGQTTPPPPTPPPAV